MFEVGTFYNRVGLWASRSLEKFWSRDMTCFYRVNPRPRHHLGKHQKKRPFTRYMVDMSTIVTNSLVVSNLEAIIPKVQPNTRHHCQTVCLPVKNLPHPPWSLPALMPCCPVLISYWSMETGFCSNALCCTHSLWPACAGLYRCMSCKKQS